MKKDPYAPYREQIAQQAGQTPAVWRSLEHRDGNPEVTKTFDAELPSGIPTPGDVNRREVLKLAGASLALGGLTGCNVLRRPEEEILPFTQMPEQVTPGLRMQYATTQNRSEGAVGLVVEAHEGRPTKIEGNPQHPSSLGGADVWAQAEVLKLYDPDRARVPQSGGKDSTWAAWDAFATEHFTKLATAQGKGLALLLEDNPGPTFDRLLKTFKTRFPQGQIHRYDPLAADQMETGAQLAFGPGARVHFDLSKADVILSLDSDFLMRGPDHLKLARQFGARRSVATKDETAKMNRLYVAEGIFSSTGTNADHRVRVSSAQIAELLKAFAKQLSAKVSLGELAVEGQVPAGTDKFLSAVAKDFSEHNGTAVILVGERQPAAVHALAYAINAAIGAFSSGVMTVSKGDARQSMAESLSNLVGSLNNNEVDTLVVFGGNPVQTALGGYKFAEAYLKAANRVHVGVLPEETGAKSTWHLPASHFLESWGDARAWDGTASLVQPLILPLFNTRAEISVLAQLAGEGEQVDRALVEGTWRAAGMPLHDVKVWRKALRDGIVPGTARSAGNAEANRAQVATALKALPAAAPNKDNLEVALTYGNVLDGRLANVTWLQELPDTMSKLCWDNAVLMSPALAQELGITSAVNRNGYASDLVELTANGRSVTLPTFVLPGLSPYSLSVNAGYGKSAGEVAKGFGVGAEGLFDKGLVAQGVKLTKKGSQVVLCSTQDHFSAPVDPFNPQTFAQQTAEKDAKKRSLGLFGRPLYREGSAAEYAKEGGKFAHEGNVEEKELQKGTAPGRPAQPLQLTTDVVYPGQQWGMVIDLGSCIGCGACTVACIAENNIPTVGREQVLLGRELHWIRIDRYFSGDVDQPEALHQPVNCMHCENAPCEPVCPVGATVHDEEGINSMAYNRCIGTRYCNNNCPFKVRRFNYLDFTTTGILQKDEKLAERWKTLKYQRNPDVTVRYRGVMEKCTYCTQRVEEAKKVAKRAGHDRKALPDGAVTPACAQTCPTQAITFGNINDPTSRVAKLKQSDRNYEMLQELNVRPRTTYLAKVRNENEELS